MTKESEKSINQLKELIGNDDESGRFIRCEQGIELYNMSKLAFMQLAIEAGAAYMINSIFLVDREIFEQHLETYKILPQAF